MDEAADLTERLLAVSAAILEDAASKVLLQREHSLADRLELIGHAGADLLLLSETARLVQRRSI